MALYLIGDIQGCNAAFQTLLRKIDFSPSRDTLFVLGDMVNRGEDSLGVLQTLMFFGDSAKCVLGNHDLHLLAVAQGARTLHASDTLQGILDEPSKHSMLDWLRHQRLAIHFKHGARDWLLVHAGVLPHWTLTQTMQLAAEVEAVLQSNDPATYGTFFNQMYGNAPAQWSEALQGADRLRVIVNALTRIRFCDANGVMEFDTKEGAGSAPAGYMPWFDAPNRQTALPNLSIAFGHWSTLGLLARPNLLAPSLLGLDTGCVWGGELTCYDLSSAKAAAISAPKSTSNHAT
jgi:bis(5'-nucleosyl)-tetraphosphatase (symmetrical)